MKVDLNNKAALVTGAGGAIGREIALQLAANGADVIINDINEDNGRRVVKEIEALGRKSHFINADVGNAGQMADMSDIIIEKLGKIDILVNNAGINVGMDDRKPIHEFDEDNWYKIINIDLNGIYYCSKPIINRMTKQNYGKIINISSVVGLVPLRLQCAFAAAKAGVINLTKAMALELAPYGINVNAIAPGSVMSELTQKSFYSNPKLAESLLSHIPLKRPGTPEDIAKAVLFLASDDSSYMTGSIMVVDGGWTCGYNRDW